eukprot:Gb_21513 [translate_table: standard]
MHGAFLSNTRSLGPMTGNTKLLAAVFEYQGNIDMRETSELQASTPLNAVLTPPLSLEVTFSTNVQRQKQESILTRLLNLFKSVRPGADLTTFQLPPQFNMPKSQLQVYGESVYCYSQDLLSNCVEGKTPTERFKAVVAWSISTTRPPIFAKAPYNPILGETHHVSCGNLNVFLEQVSHHPPATALYATNEAQKLELNWWQQPVPWFYGRSVEVTVQGKRELKLREFDETYEMNCPKLCIRFFPSPSAEWVGDVLIHCKQSGLKANISYKGKSLFGLKGSSTRITGKISSVQDLYELEGNWDQAITLKEIGSGKTNILYDANTVIQNLTSPIVQNSEGLAPTESAVVWSEVSESILKRDWNRAREAKRDVEEKQRSLQIKRFIAGRTWSPNHFVRREDGGEGWDYLHRPQPLSTAPIVVP